MNKSLVRGLTLLIISIGCGSKVFAQYSAWYPPAADRRPTLVQPLGYTCGPNTSPRGWCSPPSFVATRTYSTPYASPYPEFYGGGYTQATAFVSGSPISSCATCSCQQPYESLARYNYRHDDGRWDKYVKKNIYGDPTIFHRDEPLRNVLRFLFP